MIIKQSYNFCDLNIGKKLNIIRNILKVKIDFFIFNLSKNLLVLVYV